MIPNSSMTRVITVLQLFEKFQDLNAHLGVKNGHDIKRIKKGFQ